jgi:lysophospholipase L1-like esterase
MGVLTRSMASHSADLTDLSPLPPTKSKSGPPSKINLYRFYNQFRGHPVEDLTTFLNITLLERPNKPIVYLAGDSSLDNKYWVPSPGPGGDALPVMVPEIYEKTLDRPRPKPDVSFWLNHVLGDRATCINTAVEESMLRDRDETLLVQDDFIRDNIRSNDVLVVSIGANDVALKPSPATIVRMMQMAWLTQFSSLENGSAYALPYFKNLFGTKIQDYVERVTAKTKPRAVIVSMIYFPLEWAPNQQSWANAQLKVLRYDSYPEKLQMAIRQMYDIATKEIQIVGTEVLPCALYEVLDGKEKKDYTDRVEPSADGGKKMAERFVELLKGIV